MVALVVFLGASYWQIVRIRRTAAGKLTVPGTGEDPGTADGGGPGGER